MLSEVPAIPPSLRIVAGLCALVVATPTFAEDSAGDPRAVLPILLKVLTYDRNFAARSTGDFVVLVASEDGKPPPFDASAVARELRLASINDRRLRFVAATFKDQASLAAAIQANSAKAVLAAPGVSPSGIKDISEVAQDNQIYTLTVEPDAMNTLAVGVVAKDGKPQIVINVGAAKAIGAVFETSVLKLARVVQ